MPIMPCQWLVDLRGERHQADIAKAVGISQQAYSAYEHGMRTPYVPTAKAIAKRLEFDWTLFYEDKGEEGPAWRLRVAQKK